MPQIRLTHSDKESMARTYKAKQASQADLAVQFGVSRTTVRRALQEFGLVTNNCEATPQERSMLDVIKAYGVENVDCLRQVLQRGLKC